MKVCFLNHSADAKTGSGRFFSELIAALRQRVPQLEYKVLTHDDVLPTSFFKALWSLPRLRRIFSGYEIIHALDGWPFGVLALLALIGLNKKLVITAIGTGAVQPLYYPLKRWLLAWAYRRAARLVAVSNNTKQEILKVLPKLSISVINHGVAADRFSSLGKKSSEFNEWKPYILTAGALKKRKGMEYVVRAFAIAARQLTKLRLVIYGRGPEHRPLLALAQELGVADRVVFPFYDSGLKDISDERLTALYRNAELFILLPQDIHKDIEGFGLVLLEAAACGLPVIGARDSGAEDGLIDGYNGYLVAPTDAGQAAARMQAILTDPKLHEKFSANSVSFAKKMSWDKAATAYLNLYEHLNQ